MVILLDEMLGTRVDIAGFNPGPGGRLFCRRMPFLKAGTVSGKQLEWLSPVSIHTPF
jgi:hypothetical protein